MSADDLVLFILVCGTSGFIGFAFAAWGLYRSIVSIPTVEDFERHSHQAVISVKADRDHVYDLVAEFILLSGRTIEAVHGDDTIVCSSTWDHILDNGCFLLVRVSESESGDTAVSITAMPRGWRVALIRVRSFRIDDRTFNATVSGLQAYLKRA